MAPAPTKKSKDQIKKAATQKKGGHKKWTKGKTKEKSEHAVFLDRAAYDRMITGIPKIGKHISVSGVIEKYKVNGSIARMVLRDLLKSGSLKSAEKHGKQALLYPAVAPVDKVAGKEEEKTKKKGGKKKE